MKKGKPTTQYDSSDDRHAQRAWFAVEQGGGLMLCTFLGANGRARRGKKKQKKLSWFSAH
jgi:hypothetical protein